MTVGSCQISLLLANRAVLLVSGTTMALLQKFFHIKCPGHWNIGCCSHGAQCSAAAWTAKARGAVPFSPELQRATAGLPLAETNV